MAKVLKNKNSNILINSENSCHLVHDVCSTNENSTNP